MMRPYCQANQPMLLNNYCLRYWPIAGALFLALGAGMGCQAKKQVQVTTDQGAFTIQLSNATPKHRDNFLRLVKREFYDGLLIHKVVPEFMIQMGDPDSRGGSRYRYFGLGGPGYGLTPEAGGGVHTRGAVAMMNAPGSKVPQSSGSIFFVVVGRKISAAELDRYEQDKGIKYTPAQRAKYLAEGGAPWLDQEYTVFGEVTAGMEVVEQISKVTRDKLDRPLFNLFIKKATVR